MFDRQALTAQLEEALMRQDMELAEKIIYRLIDYLQLLTHWNQTYNLTAIRDPQEMIQRHLIDSLTILPYLKGSRFIDVGTGAGLPGMVAAIADPTNEWVLLDSNQKKTRFLTQVKIELALQNVEIVHSRVEDYQDEMGFDQATSRAVSSLISLRDQAAHLTDQLVAMKGQIPDQELSQLSSDCDVAVHQIQLVDEPSSRCIITIQNKNQ